ncbi:MAG: hypothetical protein AAF990_16645 [Bacteroidota bacterium]
MNDTIKTLIKTYSQHGVEAVEGDGQILLDAFELGSMLDLMKIHNFPEYKELVRKIQDDIEMETENANAPAEQVIECLKLVLDYAEDLAYLEITTQQDYEYKMEIVRKLMYKNFEKWNITDDRLLNHFSFLFPKLKDWNLYFISYTNKNAFELNCAYQTLFRQFEIIIDTTDTIMHQTNFFSKLIYDFLKKENIRKGFYDKENLHHGNDFEKKIIDAINNSFVFIQVITRSALWNVVPNWPFKEYEMFMDAHKRTIQKQPAYEKAFNERFRFIKCSENGLDVAPGGGIPRLYRGWQKHFEKVQHEIIDPSLSKIQVDKIMYKLCISVKEFVIKDLISKVPEPQ